MVIQLSQLVLGSCTLLVSARLTCVTSDKHRQTDRVRGKGSLPYFSIPKKYFSLVIKISGY